MAALFLEDYTLLDEIGTGGYATVFKVRHNRLGYIRAIRVLNQTITSQENTIYEKFLEECKLLLRLGNGNHPNIVHIYEPRLKENRALVEMDFVDGQDLAHYVQNVKFVKIEDVLKLVKQIGGALEYCHFDVYKYCYDKETDCLEDDPKDGRKALITKEIEKRLVYKYRVIHNDIHSGNIMRKECGDYVLLDFGLAIDGGDVICSSKKRNGALEYKSPEKWENADLINTESDIYSFGIVLYEFLTGKVPFPLNKHNSSVTTAEYELLKAHSELPPPPIFEARKKTFEISYPNDVYQKDYPDWLENLILKCLRKNPKDRFRDGKELCDYIRKEDAKSNTVLLKDIRSLIGDILKSKKNATSLFPKTVQKTKKKTNVPFFDEEFSASKNVSNDRGHKVNDSFFESDLNVINCQLNSSINDSFFNDGSYNNNAKSRKKLVKVTDSFFCDNDYPTMRKNDMPIKGKVKKNNDSFFN